MTAVQATEILRSCIGNGWRSELRRPVSGPPFWLITAPDGQARSVMGLHRMSEAQIRERVKGLVTKIHLGGTAAT